MSAILKVLNMRQHALENARICQNMPEAEPKTTAQDN